MTFCIIFLEVELDKHRTWCPKAGCETICLVGPLDSSASSPVQPSSSTILLVPRAVHCATCEMDFCSGCKKPVSYLTFQPI